MKFLYAFLVVVVFVVALLFSFKNLQPVSVNLFVDSVRMPLALALTVEFMAGAVFGLAVGAAAWFRVWKRCKRLQAGLEAAESELHHLRVHSLAAKID